MRKMASIQKIAEVKPIDGADFIVAYRVNGWWVVDKKDAYQVDDLVVYCEPDAWIPFELAPFLCKGKEPREYNGVKGEKLRTIRLKKQYSQGLILPFSIMNVEQDGIVYESLADVDTDVSEILGIQKWEPPIPACLVGKMRGNFPSFIPKTDQTRIENLGRNLEIWQYKKFEFAIDEKCEGSSMTTYVYNDREGVCSRNIDLYDTDDNTFWQVEKKYSIIEKIKSTGKNIAIQGELLGEGIQGNIYNIKGHDLYVFDVYLIDEHRYMLPDERDEFVSSIGLKLVPRLGSIVIDESITQSTLIDMAEGISKLYNTQREGIVFRNKTENDTFKAISRKYLLNQA